MKRLLLLFALFVFVGCAPEARVLNLTSKNMKEVTHSDARWKNIPISEHSGYQVVQNGNHDIHITYQDNSTEVITGIGFLSSAHARVLANGP